LKKSESRIVNFCILFSLTIGAFILNQRCTFQGEDLASPEVIEQKIDEEMFGFITSEHHFETHKLGLNQTLGDVLLYQGISWDSILKLDKVSNEVFSIRKFRAKKPFTIIKKDSCDTPCCVIYEPNKYTFIKYHLDDNVEVEVVKRDVEICEDQVSGIITSSLWMAMKNAGLKGELIDKMEDALASSVDFYHTQHGDEFKLIFERKYVDGKPIGYGEILAAAYKNERGEHYAVFYENENYEGFYDLEGQPTLKTFLRAPLKHSRISSRFNRRRFHPIKKRTIPHLGTDYAAPSGTPIIAVADGIIEISGYTKNNGKYVKIRHNDVYKTQYLHMRRFANGIKKGIRVRQGQKIGEVGMTGLATGPHVCYRFWKHGRQVNHLNENFPPKDPLPISQLSDFFKQRDVLLEQLNMVPFQSEMDNATQT